MDHKTVNKISQFPKIELRYSVAKESVWENILNIINAPKIQKHSNIRSFYSQMAMAASILLIIGVTAFLRFYTQTIAAPSGEHLTYYLPDNSKVELNAKSAVSFHPYWYTYARNLTLDGEAFFSVQKGNGFTVSSKLGETTVLGTSFNIYSRNNDYNVTCYTGKVKVRAIEKNHNILLHPNEKAFITQNGFLDIDKEANVQLVKSWRDNMFVFTGTPISTVFEEIERHYNIKISYKADATLTYTGNFSRTLSRKEVLNLVCTSLGIKFDAKSDTEFLVN